MFTTARIDAIIVSSTTVHMYDLYFLVFRINNLLQTKRKQLPQLPCEIWQSSESGCRATKEINRENQAKDTDSFY